MSINYAALGPGSLPKGPTRKTLKGRKTRAERVVKKSVRELCVERDGHCRVEFGTLNDDIEQLYDDLIAHACCDSPSEWAHLKGARRSQTRGQAPERRHTTATSLILCRRHHQLEEAGRLIVRPLTADGCNGPVRFEVKG